MVFKVVVVWLYILLTCITKASKHLSGSGFLTPTPSAVSEHSRVDHRCFWRVEGPAGTSERRHGGEKTDTHTRTIKIKMQSYTTHELRV